MKLGLKKSSRKKLWVLGILIASLPSSAFALKNGERIAPKTSLVDTIKKPFEEAYQFLDQLGRQNIIGYTAEEHSQFLENSDDINVKVDERGDELCQQRGFKGALVRPPFEAVIGPVKAYDYDVKTREFVELSFPSTPGPQYYKKGQNGNHELISKKDYNSFVEKKGAWERAVYVKQEPIKVIILKDLQCSRTRSLTVKKPDSVSSVTTQWRSTLPVVEAEPVVRSEVDRLKLLDKLIDKLIVALNTSQARQAGARVSNRRDAPQRPVNPGPKMSLPEIPSSSLPIPSSGAASASAASQPLSQFYHHSAIDDVD